MANPNKRKGTQWESDVRDYLNAALDLVDEDGRLKDPTDAANVVRKAQEGRADVGDLWALPFVLEAKNTKDINLAAFLRQAETEADNAGLPFGAAVVKRRSFGPEHGYVVMNLRTFARVLQLVRAAPPRLRW